MTQWPNPNDELFRPTLGVDDDAVDFDRPWNPWSLVVLTFFAGLIAGGGLLALNFRRLGMKGKLYPALAIVILASFLHMGVALGLTTGDRREPLDRETAQTMRWLGKALMTLIAIGIAAPQQKRFRLFQASGLPAGHLLWPAVAAIAVQMVFGLLWAAVAYYQIFFR